MILNSQNLVRVSGGLQRCRDWLLHGKDPTPPHRATAAQAAPTSQRQNRRPKSRSLFLLSIIYCATYTLDLFNGPNSRVSRPTTKSAAVLSICRQALWFTKFNKLGPRDISPQDSAFMVTAKKAVKQAYTHWHNESLLFCFFVSFFAQKHINIFLLLIIH